MDKSHYAVQPNYNPSTGEWNDSLTGEFLWSSVNTREALPDVMTPSTWSLWQIYYVDANPGKLPDEYPFCGNICGRPYLNLSLVISLYRAVGKDIRIVAREMGIPAVVGCGNATMLLKTGDRVRVDGGQGTVEII